MRLVAHLRVSSERQAEKDLSIPAQRQAIQAWAAQPVTLTLVREAGAGAKGSRPGAGCDRIRWRNPPTLVSICCPFWWLPTIFLYVTHAHSEGAKSLDSPA